MYGSDTLFPISSTNFVFLHVGSYAWRQGQGGVIVNRGVRVSSGDRWECDCLRALVAIIAMALGSVDARASVERCLSPPCSYGVAIAYLKRLNSKGGSKCMDDLLMVLGDD
ncbi:hypothetical protein Dimus_039141 [Dionaea muscipula]